MHSIKRSIQWNSLLLLVSAVLLNACTATSPEKAESKSAPAAAEASYPKDLHGAQLYRVDAKASSVHILVYRGGTMARIGHNHVISAANFTGYVWRGDTLADSGFDIAVPVNELVVDDDAARESQGPDFPLNLGDAAKQGTKTNMLSGSLLDGAHYPSITIKSLALSGAVAAPQVRATLQIKDRTQEIAVPVTIKEEDRQLHVRGEFKVLQSDFGITPFSVAMGTLQVVDSVTIKFELVARLTQP